MAGYPSAMRIMARRALASGLAFTHVARYMGVANNTLARWVKPGKVEKERLFDRCRQGRQSVAHKAWRNKNLHNSVSVRLSDLRARDRRLNRKECNATVEDILAAYTIQKSKCAICKTIEEVGGRKLAIDHDHKTGRFRGLICYKCNTALGMLNDDENLAQVAVDYLKKSKEV